MRNSVESSVKRLPLERLPVPWCVARSPLPSCARRLPMPCAITRPTDQRDEMRRNGTTSTTTMLTATTDFAERHVRYSHITAAEAVDREFEYIERPGSARLGSARLGSARLGWAEGKKNYEARRRFGKEVRDMAKRTAQKKKYEARRTFGKKVRDTAKRKKPKKEVRGTAKVQQRSTRHGEGAHCPQIPSLIVELPKVHGHRSAGLEPKGGSPQNEIGSGSDPVRIRLWMELPKQTGPAHVPRWRAVTPQGTILKPFLTSTRTLQLNRC